MEDVLSVYQRPYDPDYPMLCLDEKGKELQSQRAELVLPKPGQGGSRQDYEYRREGSANLLLVCEPLTGWRRIAVSQDRTAPSFARQLRQLVEQDFPMAHKIVLVTDNLNIHGIWPLYEEYPAAQAKQIADKLEWHYTPEHGSWLNMAELELSTLQRQCLNRRFADLITLEKECQAWTLARILAALHAKFRGGIDLRVVFVPEIPRTQRGKYRLLDQKLDVGAAEPGRVLVHP